MITSVQTKQTARTIYGDDSMKLPNTTVRHENYRAMLPRLFRAPALLRPVSRVGGQSLVARRTLIAAPKIGGAPLMERRAGRELPGKSGNAHDRMRTYTRHRYRGKRYEMGKDRAYFRGPFGLCHTCNLQLPKVLFFRRIINHVRPSHIPKGARISRR